MAENKEEQEIIDEEVDTTTNDNTSDKETEEESKEKESSPEEELQEFKDKYLRLYSEFENFRRRTAKEKLDLMTTASERIILSFCL